METPTCHVLRGRSFNLEVLIGWRASMRQASLFRPTISPILLLDAPVSIAFHGPKPSESVQSSCPTLAEMIRDPLSFYRHFNSGGTHGEPMIREPSGKTRGEPMLSTTVKYTMASSPVSHATVFVANTTPDEVVSYLGERGVSLTASRAIGHTPRWGTEPTVRVEMFGHEATVSGWLSVHVTAMLRDLGESCALCILDGRPFILSSDGTVSGVS